jgi:hypothetical protein
MAAAAAAALARPSHWLPVLLFLILHDATTVGVGGVAPTARVENLPRGGGGPSVYSLALDRDGSAQIRLSANDLDNSPFSNLALSSTASASSVYDDNPLYDAAKLTDGSATTVWYPKNSDKPNPFVTLIPSPFAPNVSIWGIETDRVTAWPDAKYYYGITADVELFRDQTATLPSLLWKCTDGGFSPFSASNQRGGRGAVGINVRATSGATCSSDDTLATAVSQGAAPGRGVMAIRYFQKTASIPASGCGHSQLRVIGCPWADHGCPSFELVTAPSSGRVENIHAQPQVAGTRGNFSWTLDITFVADAGFVGSDSFSIVARDAFAPSSPITVDVTIAVPTTGMATSGVATTAAGTTGTAAGIIPTSGVPSSQTTDVATAATTSDATAGPRPDPGKNGASSSGSNPESLLPAILGAVAVVLVCVVAAVVWLRRKGRSEGEKWSDQSGLEQVPNGTYGNVGEVADEPRSSEDDNGSPVLYADLASFQDGKSPGGGDSPQAGGEENAYAKTPDFSDIKGEDAYAKTPADS